MIQNTFYAARLMAGSLALIVLAPAIGKAQSAPAQNSTSDVVQMSAFEISAENVEGYATTSSTAASRISVPITELPTSVITINEKIIADTVAISAEDTLNLIGGVSAMAETRSNQSNRFSARGYTTSGAQRDGFPDLLFGQNGGFNYAFVERIEYVKGPNGILYGQHTPGGVLNFVSKKPLGSPRTTIGAMVGSYGLYRGDLDTSNYFDRDRKFGYRLSASYMLNKGALDHPGEVFIDEGFLAINPVVNYRSDNGLEVWLWTGFIRDKSPRMNRITKTFQRSGDGIAHPLKETLEDGLAHNIVTNQSEVSTDSYEFGATKSFELGAVKLDARVLARYIDQFDSGALVTTAGSDTFVDPNGNIIGTDARTIDFSLVDGNLGGFYRPGLQTTGRKLATQSYTYASDFGFSFDIGATKHKLLVFGAINEFETASDPGINGIIYRLRDAAAADVLASLGAEVVNGQPRIWLNPLGRIAFAGIDPQVVVDNATVANQLSFTVTQSDQVGYGFMERMSWWDNRAIVVAGMRHTDNDTTVTVNNGTPSSTSDGSWTSSFGALGKIYDGEAGEFALFFNSNETFVPVFSLDQRLATFGEKFPNRTIDVEEFGIKLDLLDSRLVATASVFDMTEDNVLIRLTDVDGSITGEVDRSYSVPGGARSTDGWELDLAYNVAPGLDTVFSYGRRDAKLEDGSIPHGQPDATFSGLARYELADGTLKGLSLLWQYTWWGDSILSTRTSWKIPAGGLHTAVIGYRWGNMDFRLRVENVFDDLNLLPSVNETAVGVTNHRNYRFAVSYRF